jgi:hypothetical protein
MSASELLDELMGRAVQLDGTSAWTGTSVLREGHALDEPESLLVETVGLDALHRRRVAGRGRG